MFALNAWGSYGQQQDSPSKTNPRMPSSLHALAEGNNNSEVGGNQPIAQPQARHSDNIVEPRGNRSHPGTIGTPVHLENTSSKSLVDLIQEDLPMFSNSMSQQQPQIHHHQQQPAYNGGLNDGYMSHLHNSMSGLSMVSLGVLFL